MTRRISPDNYEELLEKFEMERGDISTWDDVDYMDFVYEATCDYTEDIEFDEKLFLISYEI